MGSVQSPPRRPQAGRAGQDRPLRSVRSRGPDERGGRGERGSGRVGPGRGSVPPGAISLADGGRRSLALLVGTAIALVVFAARLVDLQAVQGPELATAALDQRLRTVTIQAERGSILDASGQPLALTIEARNLTADQRLIADPMDTAQQLAPLLGIDAYTLSKRLKGTRAFAYIAKELSVQTWRRVEALRIPGLFSEKTSIRVYPGGDLAANVIGYVGAQGQGLGGIEYAFDDLLAGRAGSETYEGNPGGRLIPTTARSLVQAEPGSSVRLTIDRDLQFMAQRAIAGQVAKSGSDSGTVIVVDSRTGDILALATAPTFNANNVASTPADLLGNRALSDVYEPGSTSKAATLAAVIDQGAASPSSWFRVPPEVKRGPNSFHDHDGGGKVSLTLAGVMARSSNGGTIMAAERIGARSLYGYLRKFGYGEKTGLGFPGESAGRLPELRQWNTATLPTVAFGQGVSVNAVQMAMVYATLANDGLRVRPRLVDAVVDPQGRIRVLEPEPATRVVKPSTARQIRQMLEMVVSDAGTAPMARIAGYRIAGKTGTAQYVDPSCGCYNGGVIASFIGMAPADQPGLVVAVTLVNPRHGRYGGELAAPVFKKVMRYALQARHVAPTGTPSPRLTLTAAGT